MSALLFKEQARASSEAMSRKHLRAVANPLDELPVSSSATVRGKVNRARR